MHDRLMAVGSGVKAESEIKVVFPEAGVIRVESARLFSYSALDGALCRRFLRAALRLPDAERRFTTWS